MIRNVWGLSNVAHKYFIEHVSDSKHIKSIIFKRFLTFIQSIRNSKKKCLAALADFCCNDQGSTSCQNLNIISKESGLDNILDRHPSEILQEIVYSPIPIEDLWKINLLDELFQLRSGNLELEGDSDLTYDEIQDLIKWVTSV